MNAALARSWTLHSDWQATLRAESINLFNTPQFADPNPDLSSPAFEDRGGGDRPAPAGGGAASPFRGRACCSSEAEGSVASAGRLPERGPRAGGVCFEMEDRDLVIVRSSRCKENPA